MTTLSRGQSTGSTKRSTVRRRDMLDKVKRQATASRLTAAAGVLAVSAAAFALWRKSEWRDEAINFGRSMADRAQSITGKAVERARAMGDHGPAVTPAPPAVIA